MYGIRHVEIDSQRQASEIDQQIDSVHQLLRLAAVAERWSR
jgi:hypothetical protein